MRFLVSLACAVVAALVLPAVPVRAVHDLGVVADRAADLLAKRVAEAAGAAAWPGVKAVAFTFVVESGGEERARAEHRWDVVAGRDTVTFRGRTVTVDVRGGAGGSEDEKAAYARWVNDTYWLLVPLKLFDPGVVRRHGGVVEEEGRRLEVLDLSFESVGLTPTDRYRLYVEPERASIVRWDHRPATGAGMTATWSAPERAGPLNLSLERRIAGTDRVIRFEGVVVE